MLKKFKKALSAAKHSMKVKLVVSMSLICVVLLASCVISVKQYTAMNEYVSDLIADDIGSINAARKLSDLGYRHNLNILLAIGGGGSLPEFDQDEFKANCDSLRASQSYNTIKPLADSLLYSYSAYMLTSLEMERIPEGNFNQARDWYFNRLQPSFNRMNRDIDRLSSAIYEDMERNSATFQRGFYRSIIPGIVAVGAGILLVVMLLFFIMSFYVNPLARMLRSLDDYRTSDKKYTCAFDGDDQLSRLNSDILELAGENQQLRKRINSLRTHQE